MENPAYRDNVWFEQLYAENGDPWNFASSNYEQQKYRAALQTLEGKRFARAFDAGCSIGVFTQMLAPQCDVLLAADLIEVAVKQAKLRCKSLTHVVVERRDLPLQWPEGTFDLVVLGELLYFFDEKAFSEVVHHTVRTTRENATVLLVNHLPSQGDVVVNRFFNACSPHLMPTYSSRSDAYRIDVLARAAEA